MTGVYEFNTSKTENVEIDDEQIHCASLIPMIFGNDPTPKICVRVAMCTVAGARLPEAPGKRGHVIIAVATPGAPGAFVALTTAEARRIAEGIIKSCNDVDDASAHG